MNVLIEFQSPDYSVERNGPAADFRNPGFHVEAAGFDLDFDTLTIYPRGIDMDENLTLAVKAPYMNEDSEECGMIGWLIQPEARLLAHYPELSDRLGQRYGRVIVVPARPDAEQCARCGVTRTLAKPDAPIVCDAADGTEYRAHDWRPANG